MHTSSSRAFGSFEFDAVALRLRRDGVVIPLEPKALDVLILLLDRAPRVVEKPEIFASVWHDVSVTDNALTRVIAQLRRALDDDAKSPRYIETVATRGYRMIAEVREAREVASVPAAAPAAEPPQARMRPAMIVGIVGAIALMALIAVARPAFRAGAKASDANASGPDIARMATLSPTQVTTGPKFDGFPAFSPDGTSIAFVSDRSGSFEIYVQGLAPGSTPTPLTSNGRQNIHPAWSPDGQFIAYHEAADDGIWIVPSRGGSARRLVDFGARPAWSPDGHTIAFHTLPPVELGVIINPGTASTIWTVDVNTGVTRQMTQNGSPPGPNVMPRWSKDGRRLYFAETPAPFRGTDDGWYMKIWSVDASGGDMRQESGGTRAAADYVVAPDGSGAYAAMTEPDSIWWIPFGGSTTQARPTGLPNPGFTGQLAITPDGRQLAWATLTSTTKLWSVSTSGDTATAQTLSPIEVGTGIRAAKSATASDGRLAYSGMVRGGTPQIWIRETDGRTRQITFDPGDHLVPFWLAGNREVGSVSVHDGIRVFTAVDATTGRERDLFRVSDLPLPEGTSLAQVFALNLAPTPDLTRVVMTLVRDNVPNLWIATLANGRPDGRVSQITFEKEGASFSEWSPDGRWLAYQSADGANTQVVVIGVDGAGRQQLTSMHGQHFIGGWMGNDVILSASRQDGVWNIVGIPRRGGPVRPFTNLTEARGYVRYPQWDAAGRLIFFERGELTANVWRVALP